jgi:hypothetical protein
MSVEQEAYDPIAAVNEQLEDDQRVMLGSIVGSLMLREGEAVPPLLGGMRRADLQDEATANYQEINPGNDFTNSDFHFVLDNLTAAKAVTINPEGMVCLLTVR